ncbi:MAG TPA: hypothetical protein VJS64_18855 [Pyrinomonadaceae bacterium]|nr:hypothetical protein [Pyrinomonadaceae bacterium]
MLFVESQTLRHSLDRSKRLQLLEELQQKNLNPLIRSARFNCFTNALLGTEHAAELEQAMAELIESEDQAYVRGDVFCLVDHVFFLIFDDESQPLPVIRTGIVYSSNTTEPYRKLDSFCQGLRSLLFPTNELPTEGDTASETPQWEQGKPSVPEGFKRFVARQDSDSLFTSLRKETMVKRIRATEILENPSARFFLRRAKDAHVEGYASKLLTGDVSVASDFSIAGLEASGLVEREVQVSCRKTGHALFRLPTANALAVVTVSDATCSECGSPVADEKVEEVIAPTTLAESLLEDGSWLISRLHHILREMGISESEIAVGPSEGEGYGQMMSNICGESFLLVARDGELTPAFARWAIDLEVETEASHLVVVATDRIHNQAAVLLHNHARHRVRAGQNFELILADEAAAAGHELIQAFERVSQRVIAEQLCELDSSLGLNLSQLIITKFKLNPAEYVSQEMFPDVSAADAPPTKPALSLAAHASANGVDVLDVEEYSVSDHVDDISERDGAITSGLNSGNQTTETTV